MAEGKTALVTGGAGFIGSHLVDCLIGNGYHVAVVDNLSSGKLRNVNPVATFYHQDITQSSLQEIFQRENPDIVFHLAAQISVTESSRDPLKDGETNVIGTLRLLEASRRSGVEKFIYSSTGGALYGDPSANPCSEETLIDPLSPYGMSKFLGEKYVELYYRLHQVNYTILRYGNVYGPRQDPHGEAGVIAIFSQAMCDGRQPQIYGTGDQERDFVFVQDVVRANMLAIEEGDRTIYNIGTGKGTSVNDLFLELRQITSYKWDAEHMPARPGEVYKISLSSDKAFSELGWSPKISLAEGLEQTIEFFRE
tara:strand:+ start:650 stop:1576 length:927 start_codon:yes stop_codon:yes gene_type:complete